MHLISTNLDAPYRFRRTTKLAGNMVFLERTVTKFLSLNPLIVTKTYASNQMAFGYNGQSKCDHVVSKLFGITNKRNVLLVVAPSKSSNKNENYDLHAYQICPWNYTGVTTISSAERKFFESINFPRSYLLIKASKHITPDLACDMDYQMKVFGCLQSKSTSCFVSPKSKDVIILEFVDADGESISCFQTANCITEIDDFYTAIDIPKNFSTQARVKIYTKLKDSNIDFNWLPSIGQRINAEPMPSTEDVMSFFLLVELLELKIFARFERIFPFGRRSRCRLEFYMFEDLSDYVLSISMPCAQLQYVLQMIPGLKQHITCLEDALSLVPRDKLSAIKYLPNCITKCLAESLYNRYKPTNALINVKSAEPEYDTLTKLWRTLYPKMNK